VVIFEDELLTDFVFFFFFFDVNGSLLDSNRRVRGADHGVLTSASYEGRLHAAQAGGVTIAQLQHWLEFKDPETELSSWGRLSQS